LTVLSSGHGKREIRENDPKFDEIAFQVPRFDDGIQENQARWENAERYEQRLIEAHSIFFGVTWSFSRVKIEEIRDSRVFTIIMLSHHERKTFRRSFQRMPACAHLDLPTSRCNINFAVSTDTKLESPLMRSSRAIGVKHEEDEFL
jgi:hypothetical protein